MSEYAPLIERLERYNRDIFTESATAIKNVLAENAALRAELAAIKAQPATMTMCGYSDDDEYQGATLDEYVQRRGYVIGDEFEVTEAWSRDRRFKIIGGGPTFNDGKAKFVFECLDGSIASTTQDADKRDAQIQALLDHCLNPECHICGEIICPHKHWLHFHHDGCPACAEHDAALAQTSNPASQSSEGPAVLDKDGFSEQRKPTL